MSSLSASDQKEHDSGWQSRGHNSEGKDVGVKVRQTHRNSGLQPSGESRKGAWTASRERPWASRGLTFEAFCPRQVMHTKLAHLAWSPAARFQMLPC